MILGLWKKIRMFKKSRKRGQCYCDKQQRACTCERPSELAPIYKGCNSYSLSLYSTTSSATFSKKKKIIDEILSLIDLTREELSISVFKLHVVWFRPLREVVRPFSLDLRSLRDFGSGVWVSLAQRLLLCGGFVYSSEKF